MVLGGHGSKEPIVFRGGLDVIFGEGDATKQKSVKQGLQEYFSLKNFRRRGEAISD